MHQSPEHRPVHALLAGARHCSKSDKSVAAAFSPDTAHRVPAAVRSAHANVLRKPIEKDHRMTKHRRLKSEEIIFSPYFALDKRYSQGQFSPLSPSISITQEMKMNSFETVYTYRRLRNIDNTIIGLLSASSATHCSNLQFSNNCDRGHEAVMLHNNNLSRIFAAPQHLDTPSVLSEHHAHS